MPAATTPLSVIHLSDPHCTASSHTMGQIADGVLHRDYQNSKLKFDRIASFLLANRDTLGSNTVVITGDLTDSGDAEDYDNGILQFIARLRSAGFAVHSVPGNHDYCQEGNQFLTGQVNEGEQARRSRFIDKVTPQYATAPKYPHVEDITHIDGTVGGRLILLDSMQDELDGNTSNHEAQGTLGAAQLSALQAKLADLQADRANGVKIVVALHHSLFYDSGELALSDASQFKSILNGKIDCLLYGHVTRDYRYQGPRYLTPDSYEPEDEAIVSGQTSLNIPLINVENLEYMGSTLPISVLDVANATRSVYYVLPYVMSLHKVVCDEPATSFGDDLHIYVDDNPVTPAVLLDIKNTSITDYPADLVKSAFRSIENLVAGPRDEMKIDKGQTYKLAVEYGVMPRTALTFMEDGDAAGSATVDAQAVAGKGEQVLSFNVKDDGRYRLFYSVTATANEYSAGTTGAASIATAVDLQGTWTDGSTKRIHITRVLNALQIDMSAYQRPDAHGTIVGPDAIAVTFPDDATYTGRLIAEPATSAAMRPGGRIEWSNNSSWQRVPQRSAGALQDLTNGVHDISVAVQPSRHRPS